MISGFSGLPKFRQLVAATGTAPGRGDLARRFGDGVLRSQLADRDRSSGRCPPEPWPVPALGALHAHHARFAARALHGVGLHHGVVLLEDPALGADVRRSE